MLLPVIIFPASCVRFNASELHHKTYSSRMISSNETTIGQPVITEKRMLLRLNHMIETIYDLTRHVLCWFWCFLLLSSRVVRCLLYTSMCLLRHHVIAPGCLHDRILALCKQNGY